jgi:hypothetical protein
VVVHQAPAGPDEVALVVKLKRRHLGRLRDAIWRAKDGH